MTRQEEIEEYKKELQTLNEKYKLGLKAELVPALSIVDLAPKEEEAKMVEEIVKDIEPLEEPKE